MIFNKMISHIDPIVKKIHCHPFNLELAYGTLEIEKFKYYLIQDTLYLTDFSRALAIVASRLPDPQQAKNMLRLSLEAIQAEHELHNHYLQTDNGDLLQKIEKSPTCFMYTSYILKMASGATIEEAIASLLPCFWVYCEVGKKILNSQHLLNSDGKSNPYQSWINLYAGESFDKSVQTVIEIFNELTFQTSEKSQKQMNDAFTKSTQLEWMFWDSAYRLESWPV